MPSTNRAASAARGLSELAGLIRTSEGFPAVVEALRRGGSATIDGAWGSSCALAAAALGLESPGLLVVVVPHLADVDTFADDLASFSGVRPMIFPAWETLPREELLADEVFGQRLRVLKELRGQGSGVGGQGSGERHGKTARRRDGERARRQGSRTAPQQDGESGAPFGRADTAPSRWVVTSIQALQQPVPSPEALEASTRELRVGQSVDVEQFLGWLVDAGLRRVTAVELPGEFAMHGGILDVFPLDAAQPVRIELFGDELESLRRFDVASQRSLEELESVRLTAVASSMGRRNVPDEGQGVRGQGSGVREGETDLASHSAQAPINPRGAAAQLETHFCAYVPEAAWFALVQPAELDEQGRHYLERLEEPRGLYSVEGVLKQVMRFPSVSISALPSEGSEVTCRLRVESVERFSGDVRKVKAELESIADSQEVLLACHNEAERKRLAEILGGGGLAQSGRLHLCLGSVRSGFRLVDASVVVLSDHQLFQRTEVRRAPRRRYRGRPIESFLELTEGDYVVHVSHGIARYRGMQILEKQSGAEEHLVLEFQERTKVYVPVSKIDLVQKYVGGTNAVPTLSRIGTSGWERRKERVQRAVLDLASDMIDLQAAREAQPGIAFPPDSEWQREFDAAFLYQETPDQLETMEEVKADMQRMRPMDRLMCGDVGYGKTELAMRAAFKAVDFGKQVAVLVPTTVLAEQHYRTFRERMAEYPFEIAVLSRFKTKGEQAEVLKRMKEGTVDVVIGTHRLVQPDVEFRDLGLVVIDEEQRFGVEHKERLKSLRTSVDVLTLTATPIPRTLHMSLLGIRDISNLETPPQDRLAIETRIGRFDPQLIRHAILRELNRDGQVYFVHNRVETIRQVANQLQAIVPEAILTVAHGQMPEHELEEAMLQFVEHHSDVLVATTIIESGLDIPNVNTIFLNQADRYGLADLHQLRGRVGRYKHRAYCYLLLDPKQPLTAKAARRLKAIEEFSELGAGFQIAMRDLEIRGTGNILGTEQSGYIAAIGYELYCQVLEQAVRRLKGQPLRSSVEVSVDLPWPAYLPSDYVPGHRQKIELYRRLQRLETLEALEEFRQELEDRFGPPPAPVKNLLSNAELRLLAQPWQVAALSVDGQYLVLRYRDAVLIEQLVHKSRRKLRIVDEQSAYLKQAPAPAAPIRESARAGLPRESARAGSGAAAASRDGNAAASQAFLQLRELLKA